MVFVCFWRFGGCYFRLMSGLFALRFLYRFLVAFFFDFRIILGGFWEPKSVIFGVNFGMIFACRSKSGPTAPKSGPRAPKSAPRAPQERPRATQEHPRAAQERPRADQERSKSGQDRPKSSPRAAKSAPRGARQAPRSQRATEKPQISGPTTQSEYQKEGIRATRAGSIDR